jgi:Domain of unknown function (DUF4345)
MASILPPEHIDFRSAYLWVAGAVTVGFGLIYLARAAAMARMVGVGIPSASARADYRAIYGGAQIGVGVFFAAAAHHAEWHRPGLWAVALFAGGFGIARLGSLALDRMGRNPQWIVGGLELSAGLAAAWLASGP